MNIVRFHPTHVKLVNAMTGEHLVLPGVGEAPHHLIPVRAFQIQDIVGKYLLVSDADGMLVSMGSMTRGATVAGVIDRDGKPRAFGNLGHVAQPDKTVRVMLGERPLVEQTEIKELIDVSGIPTPPTPPPY